MLKGGIPIGKFFGIYLRLHYSWFIIFILITWTLAGSYFPTAYPNWTLAMKISAGLLTSFLYFSSVVIHEFCHSLIAVREGIQIQSITLFFLGGVSQMTSEPKTAGDEFRMAAAGPASSLVLGGIFLGLFFALHRMAAVPAQFIAAIAFYIGYINIFLGVFNLVPGFPLDGGRVFRSIIWWRTKNLQKATRIASYIGRAFGYLFIAAGIFLVFTNNFFNGIWLALIGWFLESAAIGSYSQMLVQDMLKGHTASEIMSQDCTLIAPDITLEHFVNEMMLNSGRRCFPVISNDRVEGLITLSDVKAVPHDEWATTPVSQAMTPLEKVITVSPEEDLSTVMQIMAENDVNQVLVVREQKFVGMVGRDNLVNFIHVRTQLTR
jgi:Zn-dependent protease/CBS domain-containing protein